MALFLDDAQRKAMAGYETVDSQTVDEQMKRLEDGMSRLADSQLARFEQKRKHPDDIMDLLANWKWWFGGRFSWLRASPLLRPPSRQAA